MTKYIFVTGGVVSGLGKGITAASLGRLLKSRGLKVAAQKLDPYINVDPGTMSPYQHGEVFVTEDGAETDLDLGHYERFIDEDLNKYSNLTTGKVYWNVLTKERRGEYLGETVQVIPHITGEIKSFIYSVGKKTDADIVITEIGGTTGDIESTPFLEAIRQVSIEAGRENCLFIHVTLVPYIKSSGEHKTKPTQHSVKELQSVGIMPNIIIARVDEPLEEANRQKIALFCNVKPDCVIENLTVPVLYEAPLMLERSHLSDIVCRELHLDCPPCDLTDWNEMLARIAARRRSVNIAIVGKYTRLHDAYLSVMESLYHAGYETGAVVHIKWVEAEEVNPYTAAFWFPAALGTVGLRVWSMPPIMPARRASPISASVWACRSLSSSMHAACWAMRTQTPLNSIPWARIQSSTLCPTRRLWTKKAAPCAWGVTPVLSCRAREWRRLTVQRRSASGTATAMSSTMSTAPRCAKQASCWRAPRRTAGWWRLWRCRANSFM